MSAPPGPKITLPMLALAAFTAAGATGCTATRYELDAEGLARFTAAGPITPEFDEARLLESIQLPGPYTVGRGDLLAIQIPAAMAPGRFEELPATSVEHLARVSPDGEIQVPLAGTVSVLGSSVEEIEAMIVSKVFPKWLSERPSIVVTVKDPATVTVTVYGAVGKAGTHELTSDRLSLSGALTAAEGIVQSGTLILGAKRIVVYRPGEDGPSAVQALPVRGLNVPFYDMPLEGGERIEVERYEPDLFTVVGLVNSSGAIEYPPESSFNLMQAIAMAGGVDRIADPPYATVFRKDPETGEIIPATFKIKGNGLVQSSSLEIKPGDVIFIGHTAGSWTRAFAAEIFRINIGFFAGPGRNN